MEKHFLATIGNEPDHLFGVRFICSFFKKISDNRVTLLHICRLDDQSQALTSMWEDPNDNSPAELSPQAKKSVRNAQRLLTDHKMPVNQVLIKTVAESN